VGYTTPGLLFVDLHFLKAQRLVMAPYLSFFSSMA